MVVLEKEHYPRDKYCAGAIGARALRLLEAIGVRVDVPSVKINAFSFATAGERWVVREPGIGQVVRRIEFDEALARIAIQRGIVVREGASVLGVETCRGGARVKLEGECLEARAVVGADGVAGPVRRSAGFSRGGVRAQAIEVDTARVPGDAPDDALHFDFGFRDLDGYAWDFPTIVEGVPGVCRGVYRVLGDPDDARERLARFLLGKGLRIEDYRLKPFAERGFAAGDPISKPHVLLAGEAAGIDIATGEGIAQAVQYGALAGKYLARAFRDGDFEFHDWLANVHAAAVGRELRMRLWAYHRFFGEDRAIMERVARRAPAALRVGMRNFAGRENGKLAWINALRELTPALLAHGPGVVVRTLRSLS
jgi:flavin-dependent dehydrogenase